MSKMDATCARDATAGIGALSEENGDRAPEPRSRIRYIFVDAWLNVDKDVENAAFDIKTR